MSSFSEIDVHNLHKSGKPLKKAKKGEDAPDGGVSIELNQAVNLTFSLKYLVNFSKSASLSNTVQLCMSNDVPLLVRVSSLSLLSSPSLCLSDRCHTYSARAISSIILPRRLGTIEFVEASFHSFDLLSFAIWLRTMIQILLNPLLKQSPNA